MKNSSLLLRIGKMFIRKHKKTDRMLRYMQAKGSVQAVDYSKGVDALIRLIERGSEEEKDGD